MSDGDVTGLLALARRGDGKALGEVYEVLYRELQRLARAQLNRHRQRTLNTGALINESFLKLVKEDRVGVENRAHFLALSARAMRQVLIDHFRKRSAEKRGGALAPIELAEESMAELEREDVLLALDEALDRLQEQSERLARVVECRFFGGMSYDEIGEGLGVSARTARLDWKKAKAWLTLELTPPA